MKMESSIELDWIKSHQSDFQKNNICLWTLVYSKLCELRKRVFTRTETFDSGCPISTCRVGQLSR